jgi:hypothetical protein
MLKLGLLSSVNLGKVKQRESILASGVGLIKIVDNKAFDT